MSDLASVFRRFFPEGEIGSVREIKSGHINQTYLLPAPTGGVILQKINGYVFRDADAVMGNIFAVTDHIASSLAREGQSPDRRVLRFFRAEDGGMYVRDDRGDAWRAYRYIDGATAFDRIDSPARFREAGRGFGRFQKRLSDFPAASLRETIPDFHETRKRLCALRDAMARDEAGRAGTAAREAEEILSREESLTSIVRMLGDGELPARVTHNDTKINNVLLDDQTGEPLAVIDLDTVMPGSVLYDFGDAIRSGANTAAEDERDTSRVGLDLTLFSAFAEGFLSEVAGSLTPREIECLPLGAMVMTGENAARFLTDYLMGDVYFRTEYPEHNLVRARAQIALLADMEEKRADMDRMIREIVEKMR